MAEIKARVNQPVVADADAAFDRLIEGNRRFMSATSANAGEIQPSANQNAFAAIVSCMDSRVPSEMIFDQKPGDLFVIRSGGPMVSAETNGMFRDNVLGSLEFAVSKGVKLIVVMTHTECGALGSAIDCYFGEGELKEVLRGKDYLQNLVNRGLESVELAARTWTDGPMSTANQAFVTEVARLHRDRICDEILKSSFIKSMYEAGTVKLMKAVYDVGSGAVFDYSKMEAELLTSQ